MAVRMIAAFTWLLATPWARKLALYGSIALAVVLVLLGFRRAGVKAGEAIVQKENAVAQAKAQKRIQEVLSAAPSTRDERIKRLRDGSGKL